MADDRLDSWKEIAAYLKRDVTTVQRWEKREGMPVHRHLHDKMGSVHALKSELDAWTRSRTLTAESTPEPGPDAGRPAEPGTAGFPSRQRRLAAWAAGVLAILAAAAIVWRLDQKEVFWRNPIAAASFAPVTDSDGTEQAGAVSRDGRFVAFISAREGRADVWVTQIGTGQFYNLSRGIPRELINPSVRTLGFSPDGALVTFWTRKPGTQPATDIGIWAVPILGGQPRPYLEGAAEYDWSSDGSRLVYHTPGPGDPMFVRDAGETSESRPILTAPAGLHSHFPLWSADQAFIYFVQGTLPDRMDVWRIRSTGGDAERVTFHASRVSHPVFLNGRTLAYLATDASGSGPWIYSIDVNKRIPHRLSTGVETYTALAASADGGRLVATKTTPKSTLWRVSNTSATFDASAAARISLASGSGIAPRLGPDYLLYVSSQSAGDSLWKKQGEVSTELWTAPGARIADGPAIDPEGRRVAFAATQGGRALLYVMNADGTDAKVVGPALEWQGAPAWAPGGRSLTAAALEGGVPHLFNVPIDGTAPAPLVREHALDPVWSPDGRFIVYSGADIGTSFPLKAAGADGNPHTVPTLTLTRGSRHLRFLPGGRVLIVLKGEIRHKDLWSIDLETGVERQLTNLGPDFEVRDFDISADGREIVLERAQPHSQIVRLDLGR